MGAAALAPRQVAAGLRADPEARSAPPCHPDGVAPTLLLVDDHAGYRAFARALLTAGGFVVVGEAADAAGAVSEADRLDPDVVLLDVLLPDGDGFDVCERIVRVDGRPAVVMTSSRDATAYRLRLAATSARGFIAKEDLTGAALHDLVGIR